MSQPVWKTYAERCHEQTRFQMDDGRMELNLAWDPSWTNAYGVALVPMVPSATRPGTLELRVNNAPVRRPTAAQVELDNFRAFEPRPSSAAFEAVSSPVPWPGDAPYALLLLLFQSPNPHHPNQDVMLMKAGTLQAIALEGGGLPLVPTSTPLAAEIKEAIASYLRDKEIGRVSEGVLQ